MNFGYDGDMTFVNDLPFVLYNGHVSRIQMLSTALYDRWRAQCIFIEYVSRGFTVS